jgi:hypothetical protein
MTDARDIFAKDNNSVLQLACFEDAFRQSGFTLDQVTEWIASKPTGVRTLLMRAEVILAKIKI